MYTETQRNPYRHLIMAMAVGIILISLCILFSITSGPSFDEPGFKWLIRFLVIGSMSVMLLICYLVLYKTIEVQIDAESIRFRIPPTWRKWQVISWSEIDRAYVREYALMGEYPKGGGGIRQGPGGWVYSLNGTYGLQIEKKSGGKILLGTQKPEELKTFLDKNFSPLRK